MSNPYENMVADQLGERFVSREGFDYETLYRRAKTLNSTPSYIYGLEGVGKTCLAYRLIEDLQANINGRFATLIQLSGFRRNADPAQKLIAKIEEFILESVEKIKPELVPLLAGMTTGDVDEFGELLGKIKEAGTPCSFTVVIDSFCHLIRSPAEERDAFYDTMVAMIETQGMAAHAQVIHLVFTARRSPGMVQRHSGASYLYNKCTCYSIQPFTQLDIRKLCVPSRHAVDELRLLCLSGGSPLLAVELLYNVHEMNVGIDEIYQKREVEVKRHWGNVAESLRNFFTPEDSAAQELKRIGIDNCFECLAWRELVEPDCIPSDISVEFEAYGLGRNKLPDYMGGLRQLIQASFSSGSRLDKMVKLEKDLRRFLNLRLEKLYGTKQWFSQVKISIEENWDSKKRDLVTTILGWQKKECKQISGASDDPLDYSYPDDLLGFIININKHWEGTDSWPGLRNDFNNDATMLTKAMKAFCDLRNSEHHCRRTPEVLRDEFDRYYPQLRQLVDNALANAERA